MDRRLEDIEQLSHDLLEVGSTRWEPCSTRNG